MIKSFEYYWWDVILTNIEYKNKPGIKYLKSIKNDMWYFYFLIKNKERYKKTITTIE